jgi:Uma2 family endonuclease
VRTKPRKVREPDVVAMRKRDDPRAADRLFTGADLLVEVVSGNPGDRERDYEMKRKEYAAAGVREYWIVDPAERRITVLTLKKSRYSEHSDARPGQDAASALLRGFSVSARAVFDRE